MRRQRGATLVEVMVATPIGLAAVGIALVVGVALVGRIAAALGDPMLAAVPALEALRRDVREAREVVYPARGEVEYAVPALVVRARDGGLVGWRVESGTLWRSEIGGTSKRMAGGFARMAVRRLAGARALVRVGLARAGRPVVLMSAAPVSPVAVAPAPGASTDKETWKDNEEET